MVSLFRVEVNLFRQRPETPVEVAQRRWRTLRSRALDAWYSTQLRSTRGMLLPSTRGVRLPSVGGLRLPSVGGLRLPSVGGLRLPSTRGVRLPSVGGVRLLSRYQRSTVRNQNAPLRVWIGPTVAAGAIGGAFFMYFFDPTTGRARRAVTGDRVAGTIRHGFRRGRRIVRGAGASVYGLTQKAIHLQAGRELPVDDAELAHKVMSEIFRDPHMPKGAISLNAQRGIVQLRGQLDRREQIEMIEAAVRRIPGVKGVDNFFHLPGTPAPNKEEVLEGERAPGVYTSPSPIT